MIHVVRARDGAEYYLRDSSWYAFSFATSIAFAKSAFGILVIKKYRSLSSDSKNSIMKFVYLYAWVSIEMGRRYRFLVI